MNENFKISSAEIDKIKALNQEEKKFRLENLKLFNKQGFPSKKEEDWKFSDISQILSKNFKNLKTGKKGSKINKVDFIKDFDHNYILLVNGKLEMSDFKFENKDKIKMRVIFP